MKYIKKFNENFDTRASKYNLATKKKNERFDSDVEEEEEGEEPGYEPEWCERCVKYSEENGIEYTPDFHVKDGSWVCDHCGGHC
jgi:hypothetical protein